MEDLSRADSLIMEVERSIKQTMRFNTDEELKVGVDLGTAYITITVLDCNGKPAICAMEFAQVVRDGLVVDYIGAVNTVKRLKKSIEDRIKVNLSKAAIAIPPGTGSRDRDTHRYVVEAAEMEVTSIVDEPTAANSVLNIYNGAVVDIGGGTTGLSIFKGGNVIYTADEPTGGTHLSLVIAGNYKIKFEEADEIKRNKSRHKEIMPIVFPVIQKIASIIKNHIEVYDVRDIYLVGGTSCLTGLEEIISKEIGVNAVKPYNPLLVTPIGIALNCCL